MIDETLVLKGKKLKLFYKKKRKRKPGLGGEEWGEGWPLTHCTHGLPPQVLRQPSCGAAHLHEDGRWLVHWVTLAVSQHRQGARTQGRRKAVATAKASAEPPVGFSSTAWPGFQAARGGLPFNSPPQHCHWCVALQQQAKPPGYRCVLKLLLGGARGLPQLSPASEEDRPNLVEVRTRCHPLPGFDRGRFGPRLA